MFSNILISYAVEFLAPCPISLPQDHPLSAVRDSTFFNTYANYQKIGSNIGLRTNIKVALQRKTKLLRMILRETTRV
jgi:hypothetical protein